LHIVTLEFGGKFGGAARAFLPRLTFNVFWAFGRGFVFMERTLDAFFYFVLSQAKFPDNYYKKQEIESSM